MKGIDGLIFKTADIKRRVTENRSKHRQAVETALEKYRELAIEELDNMLADARHGRKIRRAIQLIEPMDMTASYDRVLDMLELTTSVEITLTQQEFAQYVRDEWEWRDQFNFSNSRYLGDRD